VVCGSVLYAVDGGNLDVPALDPSAVVQLQRAASKLLLQPPKLARPVACSADGGIFVENSIAAPPPPSPAPSGGGLGAGPAVGIAVGCAVVMLCGVLAVVWRRRRRRQRQVELLPAYSAEKVPGLAAAAGGVSASNGSSGTGVSSSAAPPHPWDIGPEAVVFDLDAAGRRVVLGRGGFGTVYRGVLNGVQPVAVKVMGRPGASASRSFLREAAIMQHVSRDRNVVQFYGVAETGEEQMVLSEVMEGGDLHAALSGPRGGEVGWGGRGRALALDVARGLCFLHANGVIHRDLTSRNILLSGDWACAKIADVGTAAIHSHGYLTLGAGDAIGTLAWAAPELLLNHKVTPAADVYSFGIVLW